MEEEIFGYIENIVFSSEETGFTVAKLKEPRRSELTALVGIMPSVQAGETVRCKGEWKHHAKFGRQFSVSSIEFQTPTDLIGINKYLASGMIQGIGPTYAEKIVKKFGLNTLKIIDETPMRLLEIEGIGEKRIEKIQKCWGEQTAVRGVMIFLRGHGVSPAFAQKIYRTYGEKSIEKVRENPYALAKEIHGIGFKSADLIAKGLGISDTAAIRIDSGIEFVLWELSNDGNVCYPRDLFIEAAAKMLNVPQDLINERMASLTDERTIIEQDGFLWVKPLFMTEVGIAREIERLQIAPPTLRPVDAEKALVWVEEQLNLKLAIEQKSAVCSGMKDKLLIVTGGPGTGKSTITRAILAITEKLTNKIFLAAPTGRAAKRLSQITRKHASTIHSLLEMDFQAGAATAPSHETAQQSPSNRQSSACVTVTGDG